MENELLAKQTLKTGKVLVLGSDTRSFLSVVRSLGRYGLKVDASWTRPGSIALRSRYLDQVHQLPVPWQQPDQWLESFNLLLKSQAYDLVIPCNDPSLIPLQNSVDQLNSPESIYLLSTEVFETTQNKVLSTQLAESLGVPVPRHGVADNIEDALLLANEFRYPLILKPVTSYRANRLEKKQTVVSIADEAALRAHFLRFANAPQIQFQEHFEGVGTGVEFLAKDGRIQFAFQHLRLHEPLKGGGSSYRISIALHPGMLEATRSLISELKYSGIGMVEFRWNQETGEWIFVEINGRFWGSLPLALASHADFPKLLYQSKVEQLEEFEQEYRVGICCRNWERDKNWFSEQRSNRPLPRFIGTLARESASAFWRGMTFRERSDTFAMDDSRPMFAEIRSISGGVLQGGRDRLRRKMANMGLSRLVHRRRATRQLKLAKRILFVCKGNICRSPFAAEYARKFCPAEIKIESSGYYPTENRPSPEIAVATAASLGTDLTRHRSQVINLEQVQRTDIIFIFDDENWQKVRSDFRPYANKVFLLGCFSNQEMFISDPYSGDENTFRQIYQQIITALDAIAPILDSQSTK